MDASITEPAVSDSEVASPYPGADARVGQLMMLADEYYTAAHMLLPQFRPQDVFSSAPMRLCAIHAIELYLNAFLRFHDLNSTEIRGLQHNLAKRTNMAVEKGLCLKSKTAVHLSRLNDQREYLLVRYGPESMGGLSELTRIFATLKEVSQKVRLAIFSQPYEQSDPRFKKYW